MRYIPKPNYSSALTLLEDSRKQMQEAGISELYEHFHEKEQLNSILREEQKHICCYCQRRIDHFQGENERGSHNEHFEPENGDNARTDLQLDYKNLYACCNLSKGFEKDLQHCGEHKGCNVINRNFLTLRNCSDYFKYNTNGEILPQCSMNSFKDICEHRESLNEMQRDALQMIEVLNLNVKSLKDFRKDVQTEIFKYSLNKSQKQLEFKVQLLNTERREYVQMVDMVLYFLKKIAQKAPQ